MPSIDRFGRVAFAVGELGGTDNRTNRAIWAGLPGQIELIAREGDPAESGLTLDQLGLEPIAADSGVIWTTTFRDQFDNSAGFAVFLRDNGTDRRLYDDQTPIPLPAWADRTIGSTSIVYNSAAQAVMSRGLRGPNHHSTVDQGLFLFDPTAGSWQLVADSDMVVPGGNPADKIGSFERTVLNDHGRFAFTSRNGMIIAGTADTELQLLARSDHTLIGGAPDGSKLRSIYRELDMNEQGVVAFTGGIERPGMSGGTAVMTASSTGVELVAVSGDVVHATEASFTMRNIFGGSAVISDEGSVFFMAELNSVTGTPRGLVVDRPDDALLHLLAYEQMPAPGFEPGTVIADLGRLITNGNGIAVLAARTAPSGQIPQDNAIFATHHDGTLFKVMAPGDVVELAPGDFRTVSGLTLSGEQILNDRGELVMMLGFTDGTGGIFVTTVPAPSVAGVLALLGWGVARRRR